MNLLCMLSLEILKGGEKMSEISILSSGSNVAVSNNKSIKTSRMNQSAESNFNSILNNYTSSQRDNSSFNRDRSIAIDRNEYKRDLGHNQEDVEIAKSIKSLVLSEKTSNIESSTNTDNDSNNKISNLVKSLKDMEEQLNSIANEITDRAELKDGVISDNSFLDDFKCGTIENAVSTKKQLNDMIELLKKVKATLIDPMALTNKGDLQSELPEDLLKVEERNSELINLFSMSAMLSQIALSKFQQAIDIEKQGKESLISNDLQIHKINDYLASLNELVKKYLDNKSSTTSEAILQLGTTAGKLMNYQSIDDSSSIMAYFDNGNIGEKDQKTIDKLINKFISSLEDSKKDIVSSSTLKLSEANNQTFENDEALLSANMFQSKMQASSSKENKSSDDKLKDYEDKLLDKIASSDDKNSRDDKAEKISRATSFISQLSLDKMTKTDVSDKTPIINRSTFNMDFVKAMKFMELNGVKELTVKIMPKELGELIIKVSMEGEVMKANITATNKEAYNIINSNLADINNKLSEQNVKIHTFNVDIYNGDTSAFNQGNYNGDGNSHSKKSSIGLLENEDVEQVDDNSYDYSNVNALA